MSPAPARKVGLALGGGSARGWAHVGVLRGLEKRGIRPDVVCGTSAGALVGAAFALGRLDEIERWLALLQWRDVVGYLDFSFKGGVIKGRRLFDFFAEHVGDRNIEDLPMPFGAVATDLSNGDEIWLRRGSLFAAVRASVSIPGFLQPVKLDGRWLVDGGIVDPVPVELCRALGADIVIGVDINKSLLDEDRPLGATRLPRRARVLPASRASSKSSNDASTSRSPAWPWRARPSIPPTSSSPPPWGTSASSSSTAPPRASMPAARRSRRRRRIWSGCWERAEPRDRSGSAEPPYGLSASASRGAAQSWNPWVASLAVKKTD